MLKKKAPQKKAATKKTTRGGKAPAIGKPSEMPTRIFAQVSPKSMGGSNLFYSAEQLQASSVSGFASEPELIKRTISRLTDAGFEVLQATPYTINIAGTRRMFEKAFAASLYTEERPCMKSSREDDTATFIEAKDAPIRGMIDVADSSMADLIEGVAIEEPRYYFGPSNYAPLKSYWHLRLPGDVSLGCNADRAHRAGVTGRGVRIAMCDSGQYAHPFFASRGYRVQAVTLGPGAANPERDESGHGTGESANIFAVAPDIELLPVKMNFANTIGAFNAAVALRPNIITCSWGSDKRTGPLSAADLALAAAIASAVASGITVVFSAGNGHWGFPGQHPDVISAGGVFMSSDEALRASDYASGFPSNIYRGRRVPDLCGLVGMRPSAAYIMLPVEPGDALDVGGAGGTHPAKDESTNSDGWAAFSGTSAAAPQLAGADSRCAGEECARCHRGQQPPQHTRRGRPRCRQCHRRWSGGCASCGTDGEAALRGRHAHHVRTGRRFGFLSQFRRHHRAGRSHHEVLLIT
jgi:hypothetical protein